MKSDLIQGTLGLLGISVLCLGAFGLISAIPGQPENLLLPFNAAVSGIMDSIAAVGSVLAIAAFAAGMFQMYGRQGSIGTGDEDDEPKPVAESRERVPICQSCFTMLLPGSGPHICHAHSRKFYQIRARRQRFFNSIYTSFPTHEPLCVGTDKYGRQFGRQGREVRNG